MKLFYDFHLHSCLSPCGDNDMTPYNLVNMAALLGLQIIALTDHNSAGNCRSAMAAGRDAGVTVVPGMELCCAEEIHVVCLFPDADSADAFHAHIRPTLPPIQNKARIYGEQRYMDAEDAVLGEEPILLVTASGVGVGEAPALCRSFGGYCFPAHIDRASYSIVATLGTITANMGFRCAEVSLCGDPQSMREKYPDLRDMTIFRSSDAHCLENMREAERWVELPENSPSALIAYLNAL